MPSDPLRHTSLMGGADLPQRHGPGRGLSLHLGGHHFLLGSACSGPRVGAALPGLLARAMAQGLQHRLKGLTLWETHTLPDGEMERLWSEPRGLELSAGIRTVTNLHVSPVMAAFSPACPPCPPLTTWIQFRGTGAGASALQWALSLGVRGT